MVMKMYKEDVKAVFKFIVAGYFCDILDKNAVDLNISNKDKDLLKMVANGLDNEEIAWKMKAPITVIRSKIDEIFKKLENKNRTKDAIWALTNQIFAI